MLLCSVLGWITFVIGVAFLVRYFHQKLNTLNISYVSTEPVCGIWVMKVEPFFRIILLSAFPVNIKLCNRYCYFLYSSEIYTWKNIIFDLTLPSRITSNNFDKFKVNIIIQVFHNFETNCSFFIFIKWRYIIKSKKHNKIITMLFISIQTGFTMWYSTATTITVSNLWFQ